MKCHVWFAAAQFFLYLGTNQLLLLLPPSFDTMYCTVNPKNTFQNINAKRQSLSFEVICGFSCQQTSWPVPGNRKWGAYAIRQTQNKIKRREHSSNGMGGACQQTSKRGYSWSGSIETDGHSLWSNKWDLWAVMAREHFCHTPRCHIPRAALYWLEVVCLSINVAADAPDSAGVTCSSADICWPLIAAWNFTRTGRRSVFARRFTCVFFTEGGACAVTRRHTDAVHVFLPRWLQNGERKVRGESAGRTLQ